MTSEIIVIWVDLVFRMVWFELLAMLAMHAAIVEEQCDFKLSRRGSEIEISSSH